MRFFAERKSKNCQIWRCRSKIGRFRGGRGCLASSRTEWARPERGAGNKTSGASSALAYLGVECREATVFTERIGLGIHIHNQQLVGALLVSSL